MRTGTPGGQGLALVFGPRLVTPPSGSGQGQFLTGAACIWRLFDGVAALIGLRQRSAFEGQAAMELEFAALDVDDDTHYPFGFEGEALDWAPMITALEGDRSSGLPVSRMARRFHNTLTEMIVTVANREALPRVRLTRG